MKFLQMPNLQIKEHTMHIDSIQYTVVIPEDTTASAAVLHTMNVEKATRKLDDFPPNIFYLPFFSKVITNYFIIILNFLHELLK